MNVAAIAPPSTAAWQVAVKWHEAWSSVPGQPPGTAARMMFQVPSPALPKLTELEVLNGFRSQVPDVNVVSTL